MQELEKILEEIEKQKKRCLNGEYEPAYGAGALDMANAIKDIIRKHLSREKAPEIARSSRDNDGWIPVEERLPDEGQEAWVTENTDCVRRGTYTEIFGSAMRKGFICSDGFMYIGNAFAWQPYIVPEPYRPERSEE